MKTPFGQLTYCSNIHPGEAWPDHLAELKKNIPSVKKAVSPEHSFGIGLRLANEASIELSEPHSFDHFKSWLAEQDCFVFTMNGFPYGGFHNTRVKDRVHAPDWTTNERLDYTKRLFRLLSGLLPDRISTGGISTSPLSYRPWWKSEEDLKNAVHAATRNILETADALSDIFDKTGQLLHLDIEPEPDGILGNSRDFFHWYLHVLEPMAENYFSGSRKGAEIIRRHIQMCFDVCHFAVEYEDPVQIVEKLEENEIHVGKIQISSALEVNFDDDNVSKLRALSQFNEPVYLHQVVARKKEGGVDRFPDLGDAIARFPDEEYSSWRIHFHVPIFIENYGLLRSTQPEIKTTLDLLKKQKFTDHLEIETYTWGVLPDRMQVPTDESVIREINWVKDYLK